MLNAGKHPASESVSWFTIGNYYSENIIKGENNTTQPSSCFLFLLSSILNQKSEKDVTLLATYFPFLPTQICSLQYYQLLRAFQKPVFKVF